jgi:hypothetical protein
LTGRTAAPLAVPPEASAPAPDDPAAFARQVRDALAHLYDPVALQTHPLARSLGLDAPRASGARERPGSQPPVGRALRQRLVEAIAALRPELKRGEVAGASPTWRAQRLLELRYVEALDPPAVQAQLGIEKSQYYREHARALDALVSLLVQQSPAAPFAAPAGGLPDGRRLSPAPHSAAGAQPRAERADPGRPAASPTLGRGPLPDADPAAPPAQLVAALTSFVGREQELAALQERLAGQAAARLLTLTGPGGVGKTRLALQLASSCLPNFPDGIRVVDLAPVAEPAVVPQVVALAAGVGEEPGRPIQTTLADALQAKRLLLLLDDCEHLLDACAQLAGTLLQRCAQLTILATSREPLGLAGEITWPVHPLALPDTQRLPSLGELTQVESVALFVDRARAALPAFQLSDRAALAVAEICVRLDGLPLAIELAAAKVRALPPADLLARLEDRFRLLSGRGRPALARHQTLRAAVDWSYALLTGQEQRLFASLSVFGLCVLLG